MLRLLSPEHLLWTAGAFFGLPLVLLGIALTVADRLRGRTGRARR